MQTIEWDDVTLLGRRVLIYDVNNRNQSHKPRAGIITGPGSEAGCVSVAQYRRSDLDNNTTPLRDIQSILLVRSIQDRPPGNDRIAILLGDAAPSPAAHTQAYGGPIDSLPKGELTKRPALIATPGGELPEDEEWEEADGSSSDHKPQKPDPDDENDDDDEKDELPVPPSKSEAIIKWDRAKSLVEISTVMIIDDNTVDFAATVAGEDVPMVRITWIDGEDESSTGYAMRMADKTGKMTMTMGNAISPCKTESEIEGLVKICHLLIDKINGSKSIEEARQRFKDTVERFRAGDISL